MKTGISKECFLYFVLKIYVSNKFFPACEVLKQIISLILKKEAFTEKSSESSTLLIEKQAI